MGTSTLEATNPAIPSSGPAYDEKHPGKPLFIPNDTSGKQKKDMVVLVRQFYKDKGAEHAHSWIFNNHLFVLATPEVNVPWLGPAGIPGLDKYVKVPGPIEALPLFP